MDKGVNKNKEQKIHRENSSQYIKEVYDDLLETYQILFEHIRKVDSLIKNNKPNK